MLVLKTLLSVSIWALVDNGLHADRIGGRNAVDAVVVDGDFRLNDYELNVWCPTVHKPICGEVESVVVALGDVCRFGDVGCLLNPGSRSRCGTPRDRTIWNWTVTRILFVSEVFRISAFCGWRPLMV